MSNKRGGKAEGGGRARKAQHKGQARQFTDEDDLEREVATIQRRNDSDSDSDSDSSGSEGEKTTKKEPIIETSNLNRDNKTAQHIKASALSTTAKPELSRREREAIEKERKRKQHQEAYASGKTAEAKAELAKLAKIRAEREAAAKRAEEETKAKEEARQAARGRGRGSATSKFL